MIRRISESSWLLALVVAVVMAGTAQAQEAQPAASAVSEVTLYRNQAQIVRLVEVPAGQGAVELVVSDLPEQIVPGSLFAEGGDRLDVRAVRYRTRVIGEEPREEIRVLDEQIADQAVAMEENNTMQKLVQQRFEYLDKLEDFTASTATAEMSQGVLDTEQLQQTTMFVFEQRELGAREMLELRAASREIQHKTQTLLEERAQIAGQRQSVVREAVLFLDRRQAGATTVRMTYLVNNCGWSPSYNVRGTLADGQVRVEYNAIIRQMTGEDWDGVKLTLSTASPMISASGPAMAAFPVTLQRSAAHAQRSTAQDSVEEFGAQYADVQRRQFLQAALNNNASNLRENFDNSWAGNNLANGLQLLELQEDVAASPLVSEQNSRGGPVQGLSISYTIDGRVSLQSRSDQQMTRIMHEQLDGEFYHVASPVLSPYVYREAEVVNSSENDLLAGPVSVYLDGRFVGRTEMINVTHGQTFVLGFGADAQLHTARQQVAREESSQGGNTYVQYEYRLEIENYGDEQASVRLMDRLPNFGQQDDVKLTITDMPDLSEDSVYLRLERPEGILRWDVQVPADTTGEDAYLVEFAYSLEFDRNYVMSSQVDEQSKMDFEQRELDRRAR